MKKRMMSWLLTLAMLFGMLPAISMPAQAVQTLSTEHTIKKTNVLVAGLVFEAGHVYRIAESLAINNNSGPGIQVTTGTQPAVIYIPSGVTLTVSGSSTKPAIELVGGAKLIVTGGGTLIARGGNATDGGNGTVGGASVSGTHGKGQRGGAGGTGAGAGIGTAGQPGGNGGAATDDSGDPMSGNGGSSVSYPAQSVGDLIILGSGTRVSTIGGSAGNGGQGGGEGQGHTYGGKPDQSGGGGGGGGGGGSAAYGFGGGGIGGGGGGGGGEGQGGAHRNGHEGDAGNPGLNDFTKINTAMDAGKGGNGGAGGGKGNGGAGGGAFGGVGGTGLPAYGGNSGVAAGVNFYNAGSAGRIARYTSSTFSTSSGNRAIAAIFDDRYVLDPTNTGASASMEPIQYINYTLTLEANGTNVKNGTNAFSRSTQLMCLGHSTIPNATSTDTWKLSRTGYRLKGFYDKASGGTMYYNANGTAVNTSSAWASDKRYSKVGNLTLYAQWEPVTAQVTFDPNGGVGSSFTQTWTYGQQPGALDTNKLPKNTGYIFNGYYEAKTGGSAIVNANGGVLAASSYTANKTLYAQWTPIKYRILLHNDAGTQIATMNNVAYNSLTLPGANGKAGSTTVFTTALSKAGHVFLGWSIVPGQSNAMYEANIHYTSGLAEQQDATVRLYPAWRALNTYSITYDANGGTGAPAAGTVSEGTTSYKLSATKPVRDGYAFLGWADSPLATAAQHAAGATLTGVTGNRTLYAVWKRNPSLSYNANGGWFTASMPISYPEVGKAFTLVSDVPTRVGYTFRAWNTKPDGTGTSYASGGQITPANYNDITLYAKWNVLRFNVGTVAYGAASFPDDIVGTYDYGAEITFDVTGEDAVRVYANDVLLSKNADGKYHVTVTEQIELKAVPIRAVDKYVVSYHPNDGTNAPIDRAEYVKNDTVTVLPAGSMFRTGYRFAGWNTAEDGSGRTYQASETFAITSDVTLYAKWTPNTYTVKYEGGAGSTGSVEPSGMTYGTDGVIRENGFARTGYVFQGWAYRADGLVAYRGGETVRDLTVQHDAEITLYAIWAPKQMLVSLDARGGFPNSTVNMTYDVALPAVVCPERTGYTFDGFYDENNARYYNADGAAAVGAWDKADAATLFAAWIPNSYTIEYVGGADSTGSMAPSDMTYGDTRSLPANEFTRAGYTFAGWALRPNDTVADYADQADVRDLTAEKGGVVRLYAVWERIPTYTVTYNANGGVGGPVEGEPTLKGEIYTVAQETPTRAGFDFLGWSENAEAQTAQYQPDDGLTMTRNITLYAVWQPVPVYAVTYDANAGGDTVRNMPNAGEKMRDVDYTISDLVPTRDGFEFRGWSNGMTTFEPGEVYRANAALALSAQWERKSYVLYVNDNGAGAISVMRGGEVLHDQDTVYYDDMLDITATPLPGYSTASFWFQLNGVTVPASARDHVSVTHFVRGDVAAVLLDRRGGESVYTVRYDANGGAGQIEDQTMSSTATQQLSDGNEFSMPHATLIGWATAPNGTVAYELGSVLPMPIGADGQIVTLYAVWREDDTFTVTYDANGGAGVPADSNRYYQNDTVTARFDRVPERSGYRFLGWSADCMATAPTYTEQDADFLMGDANVTLYAVWQKIGLYTITYHANADGDVVVGLPDAGIKTEHVDYVISQATLSRAGYTFLGWSRNRGGELDFHSGDIYSDDRDVTLYAVWQRNMYGVTIENGGVADVVITTQDAQGKYPGGTQVSFTVSAIAPNVLERLVVAVNGAVMQMTVDPADASKLIGSFVIERDSTIAVHSGASTYEVTYDVNEGDAPAQNASATYVTGAPLTLHSGSGYTRDGYHLIGWNTAADGSGETYALGAVLTEDLQARVLYAMWERDADPRGYHYIIKYVANGGEGQDFTQDMYQNVLDARLYGGVAFTKPHATLIGWATAPNGNVAYALESVLPMPIGAEGQVVTLYAVWREDDTFTVTYDANGGVGRPVDDNLYLTGATVNVMFSPLPTRNDYVFLGWAQDSTAITPDYTTDRASFEMGDANVTLYAVWQRIGTYMITYHANANGDTVIGVPGAGTKTEHMDYTVSETIPERTGYTFLGWSRAADGDVDFRGGDAYSEDRDLALYAVWQRNTYGVTIENGGVADVVITTQDAQGKYPGGTQVSFTVSAIEPNVLERLVVAVNGAVMQMTADPADASKLVGSFVIERDSTITVHSGAATYEVTYDVNEGDAPAQNERATYVTGAALTLHSGSGYTRDGYHLIGWNTAADGSGETYALGAVLTEDLQARVLYAMWEQDDPNGYHYVIKYVANGGEGEDITQDMYQNVLDTKLYGVSQTGFTKVGSSLIGWATAPRGGASFAPDSQLPAPLGAAGQTVTLYAVWQIDEITITLVDRHNVNTVPSIQVRVGTMYGSLPVLTEDGYIFNGWYTLDGDKIDNTTLVTNGAPHTLYARWSQINSGGGGGGGGGRIDKPTTPDEPDEPDVVNGYRTAYRGCPRDKTCPAYHFVDLDLKLWYHDGIHFCVENELMNGLPGERFAPDGTATRAQIVAILWRVEKSPMVERASFRDVAEGDWFADAVNWAAANEIVLGYGDGCFRPNDNITREQFAAILYRYARYKGLDVSVGADTNILDFADAQSVSEWAVDAMQWACGSGVVNGTTEETLSPRDSVTRAQVAAMIMRFLVER